MTDLTSLTLADAREGLAQKSFTALADYMRARGLNAHLSLSDEVDYVVAFAIIEKS